MTYKNYIIGFILSLVLTGLSFGAVWLHYDSERGLPSHGQLLGLLLLFAVLQIYVQMAFFLHIGRMSARKDLYALALATSLLLIIVGGSIWIMDSLNGRMMPSAEEMQAYMISQDRAM